MKLHRRFNTGLRAGVACVIALVALSVPAAAQTEANVNIVFCDAANQKGGRCTTPATRFFVGHGELQRVYVNWTLPKGQTVKQWTRRWSYLAGGDEQLKCLFSNGGPLKAKAVADGALYQVVFSAAEGNGPKVFNTPALIWGDYTLELFADGAPAGKATFEVRMGTGGDVPIKASLC